MQIEDALVETRRTKFHSTRTGRGVFNCSSPLQLEFKQFQLGHISPIIPNECLPLRSEDELGTHGFASSGDVKIHYVTEGAGPLVVMILHVAAKVSGGGGESASRTQRQGIAMKWLRVPEPLQNLRR